MYTYKYTKQPQNRLNSRPGNRSAHEAPTVTHQLETKLRQLGGVITRNVTAAVYAKTLDLAAPGTLFRARDPEVDRSHHFKWRGLRATLSQVTVTAL